jgi:1,4-dihydroxy-2-naphthoyl-CoA hydrolase
MNRAMTTEELHRLMPFAAVLGAELVEAAAERVAATMAWAEERCTAGGLLHGGALMALADSCGGVCAALNLPEDATGTATLGSATNLLRGVRAGTVTALTTPLHVGRTTIVVETTVSDDQGRAVIKTTQTQAVLR